MADEIRIEGLREFQRKLREADGQSQKQLRLVLNDAADLVVTGARPVIPRRSGRAAASLRAQSSQREARVKAGGARVPYYPWLDFGGTTGVGGSAKRPFYKKGRYLYPAYDNNRSAIIQRLRAGLERLMRKAGLA